MRQLKFLLTLTILATAFVYLQNKFNFLDISITENEEKTEQEISNSSTNENEDYVEIYSENSAITKVYVEIAQTDTEKALGLSNRKYLGTYEGMWFPYDQDVRNSFWMKDCLLPLDIIFVDSSGFIIDIKDNNEPCSDTFCPSITPSKEYRYVLEVNANFAQNNGIEIGNSVKAFITSASDD